MRSPSHSTASWCIAAAALVSAACDTTPQSHRVDSKFPELWKEFSGGKAFEHVRSQVSIGPRPSGSEGIAKARGHIATTLRTFGWDVENQTFTATPTPAVGPMGFVNVIARFPSAPGQSAPRDTQRAIIASHYDTKRMEGVTFVGANDSASSTGALLELARVLATVPDLARQVELVFFDGEEAIVEFGDPDSGPDGLVGSRHYALSLRGTGRAAQFRFAIVWDMIGDADLGITFPSDSPREIAGGLITASEVLGTRKHLGYAATPILDDHVPLARIARIPAIDVIDFDYPHWHTPADTLDKLSPDSLQIIGQMTLWYLRRELSK